MLPLFSSYVGPKSADDRSPLFFFFLLRKKNKFLSTLMEIFFFRSSVEDNRAFFNNTRDCFKIYMAALQNT